MKRNKSLMIKRDFVHISTDRTASAKRAEGHFSNSSFIFAEAFKVMGLLKHFITLADNKLHLSFVHVT